MLSTSHKILIARCASATVLFMRGLFGRPSAMVITRRGLKWSLNLKEGIDFAIYLLGGFEIRTLQLYEKLVHDGDVVLDIGANVGAHTLPLALLVGPSGKVFSFEPTAFAFAKQIANIALNPQLSSRIDAKQMMLMATTSENLPTSVYSSWPLESAQDLHKEHHGRLMATQGAGISTVDDFLQRRGIETVNFIKLDVDGNESDVLQGARRTIERAKPLIMLELAPFVYKDNPGKFDALLQQLWDSGYEISKIGTTRVLPHDAAAVRGMIAQAGGINALASFSKHATSR